MKKKKLLGFIFIVILVLMVTLSQSIAMAPEFQTAKNLAMSSAPDSDGNYVSGSIVSNGENKIAYLCIYLPSEELVGGIVLNGNRSYSVYFDLKQNKYFIEIGEIPSGRQLLYKEVPEEEAVKLLGNILNKMVNPGIPS